jgi:hypothetical protein
MEVFRFKPASQSVERYHSVVCCTLNMLDLISKNFYKFDKQQGDFCCIYILVTS